MKRLGRVPDPSVPWQRDAVLFDLAQQEIAALEAQGDGAADFGSSSFTEACLTMVSRAVRDAMIESITVNGPCEDVWLDEATVAYVAPAPGASLVLRVEVRRVSHPAGPLAELRETTAP